METREGFLDLEILRKNYLIFVLISLFISIVFSFWFNSGWKKLKELYNMDKETKKYMSIINELQEENRTLAAEIRRLKKNPHYLESTARKKLGLIKENEIIYRLRQDALIESKKSSDKE